MKKEYIVTGNKKLTRNNNNSKTNLMTEKKYKFTRLRIHPSIIYNIIHFFFFCLNSMLSKDQKKK